MCLFKDNENAIFYHYKSILKNYQKKIFFKNMKKQIGFNRKKNFFLYFKQKKSKNHLIKTPLGKCHFSFFSFNNWNKNEINYIFKKFFVLESFVSIESKKNLVSLYKNFCILLNNFSVYKMNKVENFLKFICRLNKNKFPFLSLLNKILLYQINKIFIENSFILNIQNANQDKISRSVKAVIFLESLLKITRIEIKSKNSFRLSKKKQFFNENYWNIRYFHLVYFSFLKRIFFLKYKKKKGFHHEKLAHSYRFLVQLGFHSIFNFAKGIDLPFIKTFDNLHTKEKIVSIHLFKNTKFEIYKRCETHSVYLWPIEKELFNYENNLALLLCGHLIILKYFELKLDSWFIKNRVKNFFVFKCPFCLIDHQNFVKIVTICRRF
nr:hypothetical protein 1634Bnrm1_p054 [Cryptomonas sp.]